jgi:hypothetical protein
VLPISISSPLLVGGKLVLGCRHGWRRFSSAARCGLTPVWEACSISALVGVVLSRKWLCGWSQSREWLWVPRLLDLRSTACSTCWSFLLLSRVQDQRRLKGFPCTATAPPDDVLRLACGDAPGINAKKYRACRPSLTWCRLPSQVVESRSTVCSCSSIAHS